MIEFYRGLQEAYKLNVHGQGLYFTTDTHEILHRGYSYANTYQSRIVDKTIAMTTKLGDFDVGTTVADLEGKTFSELFDGILFPTVYPTYIHPSAILKLINYSNIQIVGSEAPKESNFTHTYNAGAINIGDVKQNDRGGSLISYTIYHGNYNLELPQIVSEGDTNYRCRIVFDEGPQPKDSKGNDYETPLPLGQVDSPIVYVNGTYPWYASTVTPGELTEQPLIRWKSEMQTEPFDLQPHTVDKAQMFKIPRKAKQLQMYSVVSGKFEQVSLQDWEESVSEKSFGIKTITYYQYKYKGAARSSVKLIVKF